MECSTKKLKKLMLRIIFCLIFVSVGLLGFVGKQVQAKNSNVMASPILHTVSSPSILLFKTGSLLKAGKMGLFENRSLYNKIAQSSLEWASKKLQQVLGTFLRYIAQIITGILTQFLLAFLALMFNVIVYNDFIRDLPVSIGWVAVRDMVNAFFILILIIISFGTILKIQSYHYKQLLPKLLIAAILVNFSKLICGVLIDLAQVVMMTFTAAVHQMSINGIAKALRLDQIAALPGFSDPHTAADVPFNFLALVAASLTGVVFMAFIVLTVAIYTVVLIVRIIALWILVITSPLAYLFGLLPFTQRFSNDWWTQFMNYVLLGPLLAFFLWLSLVTLNSPAFMGEAATGTTRGGYFTFSAMFTSNNFKAYIVGILMLLAGLGFAAQMAGSIGSSIINSMKRTGINKISKLGMGALKFGFKGTRKLMGAADKRLTKLTESENWLAKTAGYVGKGGVAVGGAALSPALGAVVGVKALSKVRNVISPYERDKEGNIKFDESGRPKLKEGKRAVLTEKALKAASVIGVNQAVKGVWDETGGALGNAFRKWQDKAIDTSKAEIEKSGEEATKEILNRNLDSAAVNLTDSDNALIEKAVETHGHISPEVAKKNYESLKAYNKTRAGKFIGSLLADGQVRNAWYALGEDPEAFENAVKVHGIDVRKIREKALRGPVGRNILDSLKNVRGDRFAADLRSLIEDDAHEDDINDYLTHSTLPGAKVRKLQIMKGKLLDAASGNLGGLDVESLRDVFSKVTPSALDQFKYKELAKKDKAVQDMFWATAAESLELDTLGNASPEIKKQFLKNMKPYLSKEKVEMLVKHTQQTRRLQEARQQVEITNEITRDDDTKRKKNRLQKQSEFTKAGFNREITNQQLDTASKVEESSKVDKKAQQIEKLNKSVDSIGNAYQQIVHTTEHNRPILEDYFANLEGKEVAGEFEKKFGTDQTGKIEMAQFFSKMPEEELDKFNDNIQQNQEASLRMTNGEELNFEAGINKNLKEAINDAITKVNEFRPPEDDPWDKDNSAYIQKKEGAVNALKSAQKDYQNAQTQGDIDAMKDEKENINKAEKKLRDVAEKQAAAAESYSKKRSEEMGYGPRPWYGTPPSESAKKQAPIKMANDVRLTMDRGLDTAKKMGGEQLGDYLVGIEKRRPQLDRQDYWMIGKIIHKQLEKELSKISKTTTSMGLAEKERDKNLRTRVDSLSSALDIPAKKDENGEKIAEELKGVYEMRENFKLSLE
jgi:hypothetical protein